MDKSKLIAEAKEKNLVAGNIYMLQIALNLEIPEEQLYTCLNPELKSKQMFTLISAMWDGLPLDVIKVMADPGKSVKEMQKLKNQFIRQGEGSKKELELEVEAELELDISSDKSTRLTQEASRHLMAQNRVGSFLSFLKGIFPEKREMGKTRILTDLIHPDMDAGQLKQIRLGCESGLPLDAIKKYASIKMPEKKMEEYRRILEMLHCQDNQGQDKEEKDSEG